MSEHGNNAAMREAPVAVKDGVYTSDYGNRFAVVNVNLGGYRFRIHADHTGFYPHIKVKDQKEVLNRVVDELVDCINKGAAALAKPPRNCDVGTAEEQSRRFDAFCAAHLFQSEKCCSSCPCHGVDNCGFKWSQLPYE